MKMRRIDNKSQQRIVLIILWIMFLMPTVFSLTVGSNSAVSLQSSQPIFPTKTDNLMLGFARFENGFALTDYKTTCTYQDFFPMVGAVSLASGTLVLEEDFVLDNPLDVLSCGIIDGNSSFACEFPRALLGTTLLTSGVSPTGTFDRITFRNYNLIDITSTDWNVSDDYLAVGTILTTTPPLGLYYFDGATLTLTQSWSAGIMVNCTRWNPKKNFLATVGGPGAGTNDDMQMFKFNVATGSLTRTSSANYGTAGVDSAMAVAWHPSGTYLVVGTTVSTNQLFAYSFSSQTGLATQSDAKTIGTAQPVSRGALSFAPGGNLFAVGVAGAVANPQLYVYGFKGGKMTQRTSLNIGTAASVFAVDWSPTGTYIAIGTDGVLANGVQIYAYDPVANTLTQKITLPQTLVNAVAWNKTGQFLVVGYTSALTGPNLKVYYFDKNQNTLTDMGPLHVPGGLLALAQNTVRWSHNNHYKNYFAAGDLGGNLAIYGYRLLDRLIFVDTKVIFNSDVTFNLPVQFQGDCTISGRGNKFDAIDDGKIVVRPDSTLTFEDVEFHNLRNSNLICMTDAASIVLKNSILTVANDYTFSRGSILFTQDSAICGTTKFIYTTRLASTIDSNSVLYLGYGMTFSYATRGTNKNLIVMTDPTSTLYMDGSTLYSTRTGLQLSTGSLILDNAVTLSSGARFPAEGISLKSDLIVDLLAGANVQLFGNIRVD